MSTRNAVAHPEWCYVEECDVTPDGFGAHQSIPVELETADRIAVAVRVLQGGGTPHVHLDYFVPEIGDVPEEDYVLPLDPDSASALGSALVAMSEKARR